MPIFEVRELDKNSYVFLSYLVDFWCLGVKDTVLKFGVSKTDLERLYSRFDGLVTVPYEDARSLILGAIDFAKEIDIAPHPDWNGIPTAFVEADRAYEKNSPLARRASIITFQALRSGTMTSRTYTDHFGDIDEMIDSIVSAAFAGLSIDQE